MNVKVKLRLNIYLVKIYAVMNSYYFISERIILYD